MTSVFGFLPGTEDTQKKNLREATPSQEVMLQGTCLDLENALALTVGKHGVYTSGIIFSH